MKILVIDRLDEENRYREDFWANLSGKNGFSVEVPPAIGNVIVRSINPDGSYEKLDLNEYELVFIHKRDDGQTGYRGDAKKLGKQMVIYSDAFGESPSFENEGRTLKMKAKTFYERLDAFFEKLSRREIVSLSFLAGIDDEIESLLAQLATIPPFSEFWNSEKRNVRTELLKRLEEKYGIG